MRSFVQKVVILCIFCFCPKIFAAKLSSLSSKKPYRVIEIFPFFNELELLKVKLEELVDVVDYFVIGEATLTFQGKAKPLIFEENKHLFTKFLPKIIYLVIDDLPQSGGAWAREFAQRNKIVEKLKATGLCQPEDIIIATDVDEIINKQSISEICRFLKKRRLKLCAVSMNIYYYYLNLQRENHQWVKAFATTWDRFQHLNWNELRHYSDQLLRTAPLIHNGGWHFTYMGGQERVKQKILSYSHTELISELDRIDDWFGKGLAFHKFTLIKIPINRKHLPKFVVDNKQHFIETGFIVE